MKGKRCWWNPTSVCRKRWLSLHLVWLYQFLWQVDMDKVSKDSNYAKSCLQKIGQNKLLSLIALLVFVIVIITVVLLVIFYPHQKGKTFDIYISQISNISIFLSRMWKSKLKSPSVTQDSCIASQNFMLFIYNNISMKIHQFVCMH